MTTALRLDLEPQRRSVPGAQRGADPGPQEVVAIVVEVRAGCRIVDEEPVWFVDSFAEA